MAIAPPFPAAHRLRSLASCFIEASCSPKRPLSPIRRRGSSPHLVLILRTSMLLHQPRDATYPPYGAAIPAVQRRPHEELTLQPRRATLRRGRRRDTPASSSGGRGPLPGKSPCEEVHRLLPRRSCWTDSRVMLARAPCTALPCPAIASLLPRKPPPRSLASTNDETLGRCLSPRELPARADISERIRMN